MSNIEIEAQNKTPPKRLFKYLAPDRFCNLFCERMIRFSQPSALNDPFELTPSIKIDEAYTIQKLRENGEKFGCTPTSPEIIAAVDAVNSLEYRHSVNKAIYDKHLSQIGVLCLCEEDSDLLMWAHYGQSHQGFVLEFDTTHDFFSQSYWLNEMELRKMNLDEYGFCGVLTKVEPCKMRPQFVISETLGTMADCAPHFFKKSRQWSYENEWRMLMPISAGHKVEPDIYLFPLELSAIKRIILGCNADETLEKKARALKYREETKHILVEKAEVDLDEFKLNFKTLKS